MVGFPCWGKVGADGKMFVEFPLLLVDSLCLLSLFFSLFLSLYFCFWCLMGGVNYIQLVNIVTKGLLVCIECVGFHVLFPRSSSFDGETIMNERFGRDSLPRQWAYDGRLIIASFLHSYCLHCCKGSQSFDDRSIASRNISQQMVDVSKKKEPKRINTVENGTWSNKWWTRALSFIFFCVDLIFCTCQKVREYYQIFVARSHTRCSRQRVPWDLMPIVLHQFELSSVDDGAAAACR